MAYTYSTSGMLTLRCINVKEMLSAINLTKDSSDGRSEL